MKAHAQGGGLYRASDGTFWERPWVGGRRTWRKVEAPNLKRAREILATRRTDAARAAAGLGRDPYGPGPATVAQVLDTWTSADCPDRRWRPRAAAGLTWQKLRVAQLKAWWGPKQASELKMADCIDYWRQRQKHIKRGHGGRLVDLELTTLVNAMTWAASQGQISHNPLVGPRPQFRPKAIRHCRECMPSAADELHALARLFFEQPGRQVLGWQLLITAMTGCRTSEILRLRWDAPRHRAGYREGQWLWLERSKNGVNPYALIHADLKECLAAFDAWHRREHPDNPWWFPSPEFEGEHVDKGWLGHKLPAASRIVCERHITPHGLRAYYVTVRRSHGISDAQIAAEIGDATGAAIIASTYGQIPPNWTQHGAPKLGWIPRRQSKRSKAAATPPAWRALDQPANVIPLRAVAGSKVD